MIPLPPVPGNPVSTSRSKPDNPIPIPNDLTPPWQSWFQQIYTFLTQNSSGGGGVLTAERRINTNAPLTGGGNLLNDLTLGITNFTPSAAGAVPASGGGTLHFLRADGTWDAVVTSVSWADGSTPTIFNVSGSPVTTTGTLTATLKNQNPNLILAGPTTGVPAQPTFRALVAADMPAGIGGGNVTADTHPSSPTVFDDEFEFGSSLDTSGSRFAGANAWTVIQSPAGCTDNVSEGSLVLNFNQGSNIVNMLIVGQAVPAGSWAFTTKIVSFSASGVVPGGASGACSAGLIVYNSGNGKLQGGNIRFNGTSFGNVKYISVDQWNSLTSYNTQTVTIEVGSAGTTQTFKPPNGPLYLQMSYDGSTNLTASFSYSGIPGTFTTISTFTLASFLSSLTHICLYVGLAATGGTNDAYQSAYDWFRRTA